MTSVLRFHCAVWVWRENFFKKTSHLDHMQLRCWIVKSPISMWVVKSHEQKVIIGEDFPQLFVSYFRVKHMNTWITCLLPFPSLDMRNKLLSAPYYLTKSRKHKYYSKFMHFVGSMQADKVISNWKPLWSRFDISNWFLSMTISPGFYIF